ncbi:UNVERIFIED_CONTAM: hypothetical protein Sangu_2868800 [Sesamum angustifolium]|uniref:RNase H type-1 domain-containing protein n=1 Tax=Sesamum angustifolium TaxID=2727405 RepID=A0AAW2IQ06_9LAMI
MRGCDKKDSTSLLNVSAVSQRRWFPIYLLRIRQCCACGGTLLPFLGSASVIWGASLNGALLTTQRNAAKYRGIPFSIDGIILEVQRHLRTLYAARTLTRTQWKGDLHRPAVMEFIFRPTVPRAPSIVRWRAPSPSWFKLNTDGSSFGNPSLEGAAGIIMDSAGHVHLAYQVALGIGTSVLAKLTVVWRGLELALTHGLAPLVVEVDATAVISLLQSRVSGKWEEAASLQLTRVLHHNDITVVLHWAFSALTDRESLAFAGGDKGFTTWTGSLWRRLWLVFGIMGTTHGDDGRGPPNPPPRHKRLS